MKSTGIVRQVDELGRIVIPIELRRTMEIGEKDPLEIFVDGDCVVLRKYAPGCSLCGKVENNLIDAPGGKTVCHDCAVKITEAYRHG